MNETPGSTHPASASLRLGFAELPDAFAGLVQRFGLPDVELRREISTLTWRTPIGLNESRIEELSKSVVLCRVNHDRDFGNCVAAIEKILEVLDRRDQQVGLIIASSCEPDLEWGLRPDLSRAMEWIERSDLRRLVVPDWGSLAYDPDDDLFGYEWEQKGIYADWKEQVLTLADIRRR